MSIKRRKANNLKRSVALFLILLLVFGGTMTSIADSDLSDTYLNFNSEILSISGLNHANTTDFNGLELVAGENYLVSYKLYSTQHNFKNVEVTIDHTNDPSVNVSVGNVNNGNPYNGTFSFIAVEGPGRVDFETQGEHPGAGGGMQRLEYPLTMYFTYNGVAAPVFYALTMAVDPVGSGTATDETDDGPYVAGTEVNIKAVAAEGYEFVNWTAPAGSFGDANAATSTFTMPAQDVTVTANFIVIEGPTTYTLTMASSPAAGGTATDETDDGPYESGEVVNIEAAVAEGYEFVNWTAPAGVFGDANEATTTFTMPAENVTVTANFRVVEGPTTYTLTMASSPAAGGTASDETDEGPYESGEVVNIEAAAAEGYEFVNWTAPAGSFGDANAETSTFTMPAQDVTVTANFRMIEEAETYTVTFIGNGGTPAEQTKVVEASEMVGSLPSASRPGRTFVRWDTKSDGTGDTFTATTVVESDITVYAIWSTPSGSSSSSSRTPATPRENVPEFVEEILEVVLPEVPAAPPVMEAPVLDQVPLAAPPVLPQTGDASPLAMILSGLGVSLSGLAMKFRKKGKDDSVTTLFK